MRENDPTVTPEFRVGAHLLPGLIAVAVFAVFTWVFLNASFPDPAGFDGSVTRSIGFALLNIEGVEGTVPTEGFLVALILIALALDGALDGAILLARRDEEDERPDVVRTDRSAREPGAGASGASEPSGASAPETDGGERE